MKIYTIKIQFFLLRNFFNIYVPEMKINEDS